MTVLAQNKKASYDYQLLEKFSGGLVLNGQEVKSLKTRSINLSGTYVVFQQNELFWLGANIPPYQPKNAPADYDPTRSRKVLLTKKELKSLLGKTKTQGLTLIPLKVYTVNTRIKLEFALAKGKKKADKREAIKKRETKREIARALKSTR